MGRHFAFCLVAVAVIGGCVAPTEPLPCVEKRMVPITFEGQVLQVPECTAWGIGPTRQQREAFEKRELQRP